MELLLHPYCLTFYGIMLWQIEQSFTKGLRVRERINFVGRSLIWGGAICVWDDELIELVEDKFDVLLETEWYFYVTAGFLIDVIRQKFTDKVSKA